ncbi:MAG: hypothetical protein IPP66_14160 [Anaerolineales bacterium]|nr:hypothetical protein [Anaerolineales bacterium]
MTLEIALRPPFTFPFVFRNVLRAQSDGPQQEYHWVGQKRAVEQGDSNQGGQNQPPQNKKSEQAYRALSNITLGEVEDAIGLFENQLVPAHQNWIGKNYFCKIPLKRKRDGRPPVIFGRVKTCYPSDGQLENVEDIELSFPRKDGRPDPLLIHKDEISLYSQKFVESYYVRVQFMASVEDQADFAESDALLSTSGFVSEFESSYYSILEMTELNQSTHPSLYVIDSRWFDSIPESLYAEMKAQLEKMLRWGKHIFNYHPNWLPKEVNTLNRILGYKYGFTSTVLTEPENLQETAHIIEKTFNRIFEREPQ